MEVNATQGIMQAQQSLNTNAAKISSKSAMEGKTDIIEPQVEMLQAEIQYTASAKMLKSSDNMMGTLLDVVS
ncbi:MAG: hypothetical protein HQL46_08255 [Gammaproteobacteria bacterium]|nr:hypothetical protein [Gammaproteobacteria bacterium]